MQGTGYRPFTIKLNKSVTTINKGASEIVDEVAFNIAKDKGIDYLNSIAKMNFKNTLKVEEMLKNR